MFVIDTSALMAILLREAEAEICAEALEADDGPVISAARLAEALVVSDRRGVGPGMRFLLSQLPLTVHPVDAAFARSVARAYDKWGRGVHKAALTLMDCYAYSLAAELSVPLLFVGNDFGRTDITCAIPRPH